MPIYTSAPQLTQTYLAHVWEELPRHVRPTLLLSDPHLSQALGCTLTIASETFQYTGSFKFRAAYQLLASVPQSHIIAASSGNFGQAVAHACQLLGKTCSIVMPTTSARVKIEAVSSYGGIVELIDVDTISRAERVMQLMQAFPDAFQAPAYDDYRVVAGNSTLGKEIFEHATFDAVLVPIGGGGLASGLILARDRLGLATEIIGAEPQLGNDAARSLHAGHLIRNTQEPATLADGARTISLGQLNWEIIQQGINDIIEVEETAIQQAVAYAFRFLNLKVEPTGALTLAALLSARTRWHGKRICCIVSGGNVDPALYAHCITSTPPRALIDTSTATRLIDYFL